MNALIKFLTDRDFQVIAGVIWPPDGFCYGIAGCLASDAIDELCSDWDFVYSSEPDDSIDPT